MYGLMEKTHPLSLAVFWFSPLSFFFLFFLLILFFKIMCTKMVRAAKMITATPYLVPFQHLKAVLTGRMLAERVFCLLFCLGC